jgi:hypothetical protein
MEHLAEAKCHIHVLTSGNGLAYFQDKGCVDSVSTMAPFFYGAKGGRISGWSTLKSLPALAKIARAKQAQLATLLERIHPDVAVIDSEYALSPLRRHRIPVIALNASEMIVTEYFKHPRMKLGTQGHFWFVEYTDYLFHRHFCDFVLSPFPLRTPTRHPKFRRIGLIVRRAVREEAARAERHEFPRPKELRSVVFMLSGSVHASNIRFDRHQLPFKVEIVGRSGESRGNVTYHGRQMDNVRLLAQADALVINAGYSAVSEAFALRKPVFVVPVSGHAEQLINARLVSDLGLGFVATGDNVLDQLLNMWSEDRWIGLNPLPAKFEIDGAREAAVAILSSTNGASHESNSRRATVPV